MASCAIEGCHDPTCPVCSVLTRFPPVAKDADELKKGARKLAGGKARASRDPRFVKQRRKAL